ncbi:hypothetical protein IAR55_002655 [Kwoniella newhampshirensis]|uniref:Uncharacterized protein n=1 Tax=Kwoniella newhampshirensis TaxID=1651941 RepID=A0AAW0YZN7_9TREE
MGIQILQCIPFLLLNISSTQHNNTTTMPRPARQRTAAQRRSRPEDESSLGPAAIVDEQEQDAQIAALKRKNESDNRQAQTALDVGVLTCMFIAAMQVAQHSDFPNPIFSILALFQLILLPFSLTPHWLHSKLHPFINKEGNHLLLFSIQLTVAVCAIFIRYQRAQGEAGEPELQFNEIARWGLPALLTGGVEMQKRSEARTEEKMALLEGLKYDVKGA